MPDEILIERGLAWTRAAFLSRGRVEDFFVDPGDAGVRVGDVLPARIVRIAPTLGGAFVETPGGEGFLPARAAQGALVEGARLPVQVTREPVEGKAARVTARVELAGRALAWAPGRRGVTTSSRLDAGERARLAEIVARLGEGFVVRTVAAGAEAESLAAEAAGLKALWREIEAGAPCPAPRGAIAALREGLGPSVRRVAFDDAEALAEARAWTRRFAPQFEARLELAAPPLFERAGAEAEFEIALAPRAPLPEGGFLLIEPTAALTAIDVNAGEAAERLDPLQLNLAAAREAARQLRLRGIGGLVAIDFVQANARGAAERTLAALREALASDPAPTQISGMSPFGLVELSRKRSRPSLSELLLERRPSLPRPETVAERVFARARAEAAAGRGRPLRIAAAPEVIARLGGAAERLGRVTLVSEPAFPRERFEVSPA